MTIPKSQFEKHIRKDITEIELWLTNRGIPTPVVGGMLGYIKHLKSLLKPIIPQKNKENATLPIKKQNSRVLR